MAIVAGLRSDWVHRAMKRGWDRVSVYNLRILKDLTSFADSADDFKHVRRAVAQLTDPKLATGASEEAASVRSSARGRLADGKAPPQACLSLVCFYYALFLKRADWMVRCNRNLPCTATTSLSSTRTSSILRRPRNWSASTLYLATSRRRQIGRAHV